MQSNSRADPTRRRVLFVDDAPQILRGLKRLLRGSRNEWDIHLAGSGQEALAKMSEHPFDVLVTDVQMPGMDGAELLTHVRDRFPSVVRIVLTGHAESEAHMQSVLVSHQFLTKPCEATRLTGVLRQACQLGDLLSSDRLRSTVGRIDRLPTLPETYRTLTRALGKQEVDVGEIGAIVETDSGLAAKILQLVNSSFFGLQRDVSNLSECVMYVGVSTIQSLALSLGLFESMPASQWPSGFSMTRQQDRSILAARLAKAILGSGKQADQAFLGAMLHDVGTLVFATALREEWQSVLDLGGSTGQTRDVLERERLGASHAEVGAYMLGLWGLPYPIIESVAYRLTPDRILTCQDPSIAAATHVACALAHEVVLGNHPAAPPDPSILAALGLDADLQEIRALARELASSDDPLS